MSDDEDQNPSDATLLFADQIQEEFRKAYPLKRETEKKRQELLKKRYTPAICKKLNFDDTMSESFEQNDIFGKSLEQSQRKTMFYQSASGKFKTSIREKDDFLNEIEKYRKKNAELEAEMKALKRDFDEEKALMNINLENWKAVGKKYYFWYNMAHSQLEEIKQFVENNGHWDNPIEIEKINKIGKTCLNLLNDVDFSNEYVEQLANGSVLSYTGIEFEAKREPSLSKEIVRGEVFNSTNIGEMKVNETTILNDTNASFNSTVQEDASILTVGERANLSSIDYEKDEKIQRLLLENSVLKDRLNVSKGRAEKSMIFEEKNRTLEMEKNALQNKLDQTFGEMEAMRIGQARKLFSIEESTSPAEKSLDKPGKILQLIDRINGLVAENEKLNKDFEAATSRLTKVSRELKECERRNSHLEDVYADQMSKSMAIEIERSELAQKLKEREKEVEELNKKILELENSIKFTAAASASAPASASSTSAPPTDAGNTTQILHMPQNPLEEAYAEFQSAESRKRKLSELGNSEDGEAKRKREQLLEELEEKLTMCQREKNIIEESYKLHKDLASKFRQVCVALTGLQIKLKDADEGICSVQSEYEENSERQFVFKCFYGTTRIDMLDVNCASSSEMIQKWEPVMRKYIGERNSIPAFLAAVTLQLERERQFDETMHERTHTFSVLHED